VIAFAEPIDADTLRIRHEFLSHPDLQLSTDLVAELLGVPLRHAKLMLDTLVVERFLARSADGSYVRAAAFEAERG
jgi:DNA-binding IclR family transcriptional regulator